MHIHTDADELVEMWNSSAFGDSLIDRRAGFDSLPIAPEPRDELQRSTVDNLPHVGRTVTICTPLGARENDRFRYFIDYRYAGVFLGRSDEDEPVTKFRASIAPSADARSGSFSLTDGTISVTPSRARAERITEEQCAAGVYYLQYESREWTALFLTIEFYPECIAPHVREIPFVTPAEWALKRLEIVAGYAIAVGGRDFSIRFAEQGYGAMAQLVANTLAPELRESRTFPVTEEDRALLGCIREILSVPLTPEHVILVCQYAPGLRTEALEHSDAQVVLRDLSLFVDRGLVIDRMGEIISAHVNRGASLEEAFLHGCRLQIGIFGGVDRPWWFKENFNQLPTSNDPFWFTDEGRRVTEQIAHRAGASFQDTYALYQGRGLTFHRDGGVSVEASISLCCTVVAGYGISNAARAERVFDLVGAMVLDFPCDLRTQALERCEVLLHRHRSQSVITGLLEGDDASLLLPGILLFATAVAGESHCRAKRWDSGMLGLSDLQEILTIAEVPLAQRALLRPAVPQMYHAHHMLSDLKDAGALSLSTPLALTGTRSETTYSPRSWLEFQEQLFRECEREPLTVANIYFQFCACRLKDPLHPPEGFLRLIERFESVQIVENPFIFLLHPREREDATYENGQRRIHRYLLLTDLLDATVTGALTLDTVCDAIRWVTAGVSEEEKRAISEEAMWERRRRVDRAYAQWHEDLGWEDHRLIRRIQQLTRDADMARYCEGSVPNYVIRQMRHAIEQRTLISDGKHPDGDTYTPPGEFDEYFSERSLEWQVESAVRDLESERQQGRLPQFCRVAMMVRAVNAFVATGIVPPLALDDLTKRYLRDGADSSTRQIARIARDQEFPFRLLEMREQGLLNLDAFKRALSAHDDPDQILKFVDRTHQLAQSFIAVKAAADSLAPEVLASRRGGAGRDATRSLVQSTVQHIRTLMVDDLLVSSDFVESLLTNHYWLFRYDRALEGAGGLVQKGTGLRHHDRSHQSALAGANKMLIAVWALTKSLEALPPVPVVASQGDSTALAPSSGLSVIREQLRQDFPALKRDVLNARVCAFGLLPVGGKIHVIHAINDDRLEFLKAELGFDWTTFRLIHANTSIILPPMPSCDELGVIIRFLNAEGVIDWTHPELQISVAGRLPPYECSVLGASILLSTQEGVRYNRESFNTTHNSETGFRIMIYDAGGDREKFPFDTVVPGRTDIQGRRHLRDIERYQELATVLVHKIDGGPFGCLATPFLKRFTEILQRHELVTVLDEPWVRTPESRSTYSEGNSGDHFDRAINPCVAAWFECQRDFEKTGVVGGVVGEVQKLFAWLQEQIRGIQAQMLQDPQYESQRRALFSLEQPPMTDSAPIAQTL